MNNNPMDPLTSEPEGEGQVRGEAQRNPGWYPNPGGPGRRYHDGEDWTESYAPSDRAGGPSFRELLWALSLACGLAGGACSVVGVPLILYALPLGLGAAGLGLALLARFSPGEGQPGWAALAVIASVAALATGISSYNEYKENVSEINQALEGLSP